MRPLSERWPNLEKLPPDLALQTAQYLGPLMEVSNLGTRVGLAVIRGYTSGYLEVPVDQVTDQALLRLRNVGPKLLRLLREFMSQRGKVEQGCKEKGILTQISGIWVCLETGSHCCRTCRDFYCGCEARQCPIEGFKGKEVVDCFRVALHVRAGMFLRKGDSRYSDNIDRDLRARDRRCKQRRVKYASHSYAG